MSVLIIDENILINGHTVVRINYKFNINKFSINSIISDINNTLLKVIKSSPKNTYILIVDFKQIKKKHVNIKKIRKILDFLQNTFPDRLEKCIMINYNSLWKILLKIVKSFLDPVTKNKIILGDNIIDQNNSVQS